MAARPSGDGQQGDVSRQYPVLQFPFLLFHIWFACRGEKIPAVVRWRLPGVCLVVPGLLPCVPWPSSDVVLLHGGGKVAYQRHAPVMYGVEHAPRDVRHALHPEPRPETCPCRRSGQKPPAWPHGGAAGGAGRGRCGAAAGVRTLPRTVDAGFVCRMEYILSVSSDRRRRDFGQVAHLAAVRAVEGGAQRVRRHRACHVALLLRVPARASAGRR